MSLLDDAPQFLRNLSRAWISILLELIQSIQKYIRQNSTEGLFEILEYETRLELVDAQGHLARLTKHERVKFLQDDALAFQDYAWEEGNVLAEYKCSPGFEADRYLEGDRWNILISLRETKYRGDVQDFHVERKLTNTFTKNEEWRQIEMQHSTRFTKISIVFPKKRHCTHSRVIERNRNRTIPLEARHFTTLADGRKLLSWETIELRRFETYTLMAQQGILRT